MTTNLFRATCLAMGLGIAAPAQAVEVWVAQDEYRGMTNVQQRSFVAGVADTFATLLDADLIASGTGKDILTKAMSCAKSMSSEQLRTTLNAYIASGKPRDTDAPASVLAFALKDSC